MFCDYCYHPYKGLGPCPKCGCRRRPVPEPTVPPQAGARHLAFCVFSLLVLLLGFALALLTLSMDYDHKAVQVRAAEQEMEKADRENDPRAFVDAWRSRRVAEDTPAWTSWLQKALWASAALVVAWCAAAVLWKLGRPGK